MIRAQMVVILVNFLTVTPAKYIHTSAAAAAATALVRGSFQKKCTEGNVYRIGIADMR